MTLHPADAKIVLEAGWGERHPLARGGWFERFVPRDFVMIYSPVEECDLETILTIIKAAVWNVSGDPTVQNTTGREPICAAGRNPLRHHDALQL
jgi:hypothetical protein